MPNSYDFIAIGDITTDAFIRIQQASIYEDKETHMENLCVLNGAKIPYEFVKVVPAVGNSANAADSAARLGLHSALVANIGDDQYGKEDLGSLEKNGVATEFVRVHRGKNSNYHYVLWFGAERTILIKHEEYPYDLPDIGSPKWLYFSSVGENSMAFHHQIAAHVKSHPEIKLAFQPGTFQIKLGYEPLKDLYAVSELFFCNVEEARLILGKPAAKAEELPKLMSGLGPKICAITDGPKGAYVYDGAKTWFMPTYPDPAPPYSRTGAGYAFASTFTSALALGKSVYDAMRWGPVNSMSVVQKVGAQEGLLKREDLEGFLAKAPADYLPKEIF